MRLAARTDRNHVEIMTAFRRLGYSVVSLHQIGKGCPDMLVANGKTSSATLVEVKDGLLPPSKRELNDDQKEFHAAWRGPIIVVESLEDVLKFANQGA